MFIDCHTHTIKPDTDLSVLSFYPENQLPELAKPNLLSCGVHPWYINQANIDFHLHTIEELCRQQKIAAIGECGLDKNSEDIMLQKSIFEQQIALSEQYSLPMIIHSVKTHHHILEIEKQLKPEQTWLIHGYNGSLQTAQQFINKEIFISFGENLIQYPEKFKNILMQLDMNYVLLETDNSDLGIRDVYRQAALLLDMELGILEEKLEENFKRAFR